MSRAQTIAGPLARYRALVDQGRIESDPAQLRAAEALQHRYLALTAHRDRWLRRAPPVKGLYLFGPVGRGKTLLMDLLAQSLAEAGVGVERAHFHRFMDQIHTELGRLRGQRDPLKPLAKTLRRRVRVLCFDEFHVEDIADAMLLGELTAQWFRHGLTLIATSNQPPDKLYEGGLQRERFLPAIANIEKHCEVLEVAAAQDFRLRELKRHPTWRWPADAEAEAGLSREFAALSADAPASAQALQIRGRTLPVRCRSGSLLWMDFSTLCDGPRSAADYIELARRFSTLMISRIPQLDDRRLDAARRFIHLVDECYDRSVKLIATAEAPLDQIYCGERLAGMFQRTISRLIEMQSEDYLARPHRP